MKRILILGCGGAGKSTLARQLGSILGIEVIHLDSLHWRPGWVETSRPEWAATVVELLKRDTWIMDGNYGGTLDVRLMRADTVIFLDLPRRRCLLRVLKRRLQYRGRTRPDMASGCPEKVDWEFLKWIWGFPAKSRPSLLEKVGRFADSKSTYILRRPKEVSRFITFVRNQCVLAGSAFDNRPGCPSNYGPDAESAS
jgi:adenylate kinase family enzyme